jgi:beta-lactamase class D
MDNEIRSILRSLELQNEAKAQDLSIAYQRIANLEQQVADLSDPNSGSVDVSTETQVDFIRRIAAARTKFSKEAQDIVDAIDNPPAPTPDPASVAPVDPNAQASS